MASSAELDLNLAFREGWQLTLKNFWRLAGIVILFYVISSASGLLDIMVGDERQDEGFWLVVLIVSLASWVVQAIMSMGLIKITLGLLDGKPVDYNHLFSEYPKLFTFVAASFLYGVMVIVGLLLFIIPGIYVALKYQFFSYRIVDAGDGALEALRKSGELTRGVKGKVLALNLISTLINIIGALALLVGLLLAVPVSMIATASAYRQLTGGTTPDSPAAPPTPPATLPAA